MAGTTSEAAYGCMLAGDRSGAEAICRTLLAKNARDAGALHVLSLLARQQGRLSVALKLAKLAVASTPGVADYRNSLGSILAEGGDTPGAVAAFGDAIRIRPDYAEAHYNLGKVLAMSGRLDAAGDALREAIRCRATSTDYRESLLAIHHDAGDLDAVLACRRETLALMPDDADGHSELLYLLHYQTGHTPGGMLAEHRVWAELHAEPITAHAAPPAADATPTRPLRIGYVSAGFHQHPTARFLEGALRHRDRAAFEVSCYSSSAKPDAVTARLQALVDRWRDVGTLSDADLAVCVRADRIDVLVDLDGHDHRNRLLALARRPAPVQATYLGYVDTVGMSAIDWRITDGLYDRPGMTERFHTEKLYRLPACNWCYTPDADAPDVGELPSLGNGHVTFGCMNKFLKVTRDARRLWARILEAVPGSRLLLSLPGPPPTHRFPLALLAADGIPPERVDVAERRPAQRDYFGQFGRIDVALDPFPFNGITTTCDALWMGVPVVTPAGDTFVSRSGVSLLTNVGLPELIARTPDEYVEVAARLASDPSHLNKSSEDRKCLRRPAVSGAARTSGPVS